MSELKSLEEMYYEQLSIDNDLMQKLYPEQTSEDWDRIYDEVFSKPKKEFKGVPITDNVSIWGGKVDLNGNQEDLKPKDAYEIHLNISF